VNVVKHPKFRKGEYDTSFIDETPELFLFPVSKDRGTKMLTYIGNVTVNGFPGIEKKKRPVFDKPRVPKVKYNIPYQTGTKQILDKYGPKGVVNWIKEQKKVLLTDTTFRDAHQSLLATRVRTIDMLHIA